MRGDERRLVRRHFGSTGSLAPVSTCPADCRPTPVSTSTMPWLPCPSQPTTACFPSCHSVPDQRQPTASEHRQARRAPTPTITRPLSTSESSPTTRGPSDSASPSIVRTPRPSSASAPMLHQVFPVRWPLRRAGLRATARILGPVGPSGTPWNELGVSFAWVAVAVSPASLARCLTQRHRLAPRASPVHLLRGPSTVSVFAVAPVPTTRCASVR